VEGHFSGCTWDSVCVCVRAALGTCSDAALRAVQTPSRDADNVWPSPAISRHLCKPEVYCSVDSPPLVFVAIRNNSCFSR
jgi:hypothetical protein